MTLANRLLLISDLHLTPERPDVFQAFGAFIRSQTNPDTALYILGDFFNLWIGDDGMDDFAREAAAILSAAAEQGMAIHIMHGNRDFLMGREFADACHATLIDDPCIVDTNGQSYLLMHGDTLCTRDKDYMAFRQMVRNPEWQQAFLDKPLLERQSFANQARAQSKTMSSNKPEDIMDVSPEAVSGILEQYDQMTLIHGHTHRPLVHDLDLKNGKGKRIVLGDWDVSGWYVEISAGKSSLNSFPIKA